MADLQVPPAVGSSGQRLDVSVVNAVSTIWRQTVTIGDPLTSGNMGKVDSAGNQQVVSASSGLIQLTSAIALSSGVVTLSSNPTVISASSGVVQVLTSGTLIIVSASSGLIQLTSGVGISSGTVTLSSAPVVQSASSGIVQTIQSTTQTYNVYQINNSSSNSITNVQTSAVILYGWNVGNQSTGLAQAIKIYNTTSAPTIGSTALLKVTIPIPGSTAGAGNNMMLGQGIALSAGLSFTITNNFAATSTGTSASAGDIVGQLYYI